MPHIKRTYAALGRLSHKAITPFLKLAMSEKHIRVRVLIINEDKEVLLVRNWLGHQHWTLPGGGLKNGETPAEAGAREVFEETGLRVPHDHLQELGIFPNSEKYTYSIACYSAGIAKRDPYIARHRRLEVLEIAWFPLKTLPEDCSPTVRKALDLHSA